MGRGGGRSQAEGRREKGEKVRDPFSFLLL